MKCIFSTGRLAMSDILSSVPQISNASLKCTSGGASARRGVLTGTGPPLCSHLKSDVEASRRVSRFGAGDPTPAACGEGPPTFSFRSACVAIWARRGQVVRGEWVGVLSCPVRLLTSASGPEYSFEDLRLAKS